jgi:hypothetical protein
MQENTMKRYIRQNRYDGHHIPIAREIHFRETGEWLDRPSRGVRERAGLIQGRFDVFSPEEIELAFYMIESAAAATSSARRPLDNPSL